MVPRPRTAPPWVSPPGRSAVDAALAGHAPAHREVLVVRVWMMPAAREGRSAQPGPTCSCVASEEFKTKLTLLR